MSSIRDNTVNIPVKNYFTYIFPESYIKNHGYSQILEFPDWLTPMSELFQNIFYLLHLTWSNLILQKIHESPKSLPEKFLRTENTIKVSKYHPGNCLGILKSSNKTWDIEKFSHQCYTTQ